MPHKDLEEVRERWRETGMFKIIGDARYSGGEPIGQDVEDWWLTEMKAREEKAYEAGKMDYLRQISKDIKDLD